LGNDLVIPVGQHTLTLHDSPAGVLPDCADEPLGPGVPISVEAGGRFLVFPHRAADTTEVTTLAIPLGD
jgi:hypothetical protein